MAKAAKAKVARKVSGKKLAPKKAAKAVSFVDQVLRIAGSAAKDVRAALEDKRGTGSGLRARIVEAIALETAGGVIPAWLMVEDEDLERVVHLGTPLFDAKGADGDVFWGDPPEQDQLVWQRGEGTRRGADGEDVTGVRIADGDVASVDCYETSGELVLAGINWRERPPQTRKEFVALLKKAEDAYFGEMAAYDAGDHEEEGGDGKQDGKASSSPTGSSAVTPGAYALGGPAREATFEGSFEKEPKVLWARVSPNTRGGEWGGSGVVGDGIAVGAESSFNCYVEALDAASGETRWKLTTAKTQSWPASGIAIANRAVYLATNHGVHAIDAKSGKALWLAKLSGANGAPLVIGDVVVIGAKKGLYALSLEKNGRKKWTFALKEQTGSTPAFRDGVVYFHGDKSLFALDAADGKTVRWKTPGFDSPLILRAGPAVTEDRVVFVQDSQVLASVDRASGKKQWVAKLDESIYGHGLAAGNGAAVVKDGAGRIHAFDLATGKKRWSSDGGQETPYGIGHAGPVIAGDTVLCVTAGDPGTNLLCAIDLQSGKTRWAIDGKRVGKAIDAEQKKDGSGYDGGWTWYSTPFVANGILYVQADCGIVAMR